MGKIKHLLDKIDNAARRIAYHGSPHDFNAERLVRMADGTEQWIVGKPGVLPDVPAGAEVLKDAPLGRFRLDKMGTGEGAQAYGAGAYLSDSKGIGEGYRDGLSGRRFNVGGAEIEPSSTRSTRAFNQTKAQNIAADALDDAFNAQSNSPAQYATNRLRQQRQMYPEDAADVDEAMGILADWEASGAQGPKSSGKLYTAEIPDESLMLDWDKPLSEQPEVLARVAPLIEEIKASGLADRNGPIRRAWENPTGETLYNALAGANGGQNAGMPAASARLREVGIPGTTYIGGTSGERNFVVFDDRLIDIKEKGMIDPRLLAPVAVAGAGAMLASEDSEAGVDDLMVVGKRVADLDMSQAARMARAREQGFSPEKRWYHGTNAGDLQGDGFDLAKAGDGLHGRGVYMTDNPQIAGGGDANNIAEYGYATDERLQKLMAAEGELEAETAKLTQTLANPDLPDDHRKILTEWLENNKAQLRSGYFAGQETGSPTVYPLYNAVRNPFNPETGRLKRKDIPKHVLAKLDDAAYSKGETLQGKWPMTWDRMSYYLGNDGANEVLQEMGYDGLRYKGGAMTGVEAKHEVTVAFDPSKVRSVNAKFDPANIGKNDLMGSIDPRLLAPTAAAAGIGLAAQSYDYGTPEIDAAYREFAQRRAAKKDIWSQLKAMGEFGATVGSAVAGGIVGDLSRLGGYLNPAQSVEATEAGAQRIENAMQYIPRQPNALLEGFGRGLEQFGRDIEPLAAPFRQSVPYKAYEALPERAQGLIRIGADLTF